MRTEYGTKTTNIWLCWPRRFIIIHHHHHHHHCWCKKLQKSTSKEFRRKQNAKNRSICTMNGMRTYYWLKSNAISSGHKRQLLILTLFCGICCSFEFDCLLPIWRVIIMYTSQYDHNNDCNLLREYIAYNLFTTSILTPCGLWKYSRTNEINKRVNRVDKYSDAEESVSMRMIWNWKANVVRKKTIKM